MLSGSQAGIRNVQERHLGETALEACFSTNALPELQLNISLWTLYQRPLRIWLSATLAICGVGVILYILLIAVLIQTKAYRRGCGLLMLHLTLVDASMVGIHIPVNVLGIPLGQYGMFTKLDCTFIHLGFIITMNAGNWCQMGLAVNRFVGTLMPHAYKRFIATPVMFGTISLIWTISIVTNLPRLFNIEGQYGWEKPWNNCMYIPSKPGPYIQLSALIGVFIPTIGMLALYSIMFLRVRCLRRQVVDLHAKNEGIRFRRRLMMARVLFVSALWYCVCYYPQTIMAASRAPVYVKSVTGWQLWLRTVFLCGYAMTPIIFFTLNYEYRTGILHLLNKWFKCRFTLPTNGILPTVTAESTRRRSRASSDNSSRKRTLSSGR